HYDGKTGCGCTYNNVDGYKSLSHPFGQLAALYFDRHELGQLLFALLGLGQRSSRVDGQDQRAGRQMVQEGRLRGIEVGLEALDAVEVRARSNPLDIGQPLITDFGEGRTEVELPKRDVGGMHRLRSQDQLGCRQNPGGGDAADRALAFDVELAEGLELVTKELRSKRAPPPRRQAVQA